MDNETIAYCAVIIVLMIYVVTGSQFILSLVAVSAVLYVLPLNELPKLLGYLIATDILFSIFLIHTAASTLGGLQIALLAGLIYAMMSREFREALGTKLIAINGNTGLLNMVKAFSIQGLAWIKYFGETITSDTATAPTPMTYEWVIGRKPGGFRATRTFKTLNYFMPWLFTKPCAA